MADRQRLAILPGALAALAVRNYRTFFLGLLVSVTGPWMQTTAQAWLVLKLTNSSLALATVTSLQFLPIMLLSMVGGVMADRFPRQKLMLATQALGALQALVLGLLVATGQVTIWHIYALALGLGVVNALDTPLRQAFVSELVPLASVPNAVALTAMVQNLGRILGPAAGGVVIAAFGVEKAFFLNALTFLGLILALLTIRQGDLQARTFPARRSVVAEIGESLAYARRRPTILFLLIATGFIGMFGQNFTTIVPLVAEYVVHAGTAEFGILNSCLGIGSFVSAFLLTGLGVPSVRRILVSGSTFGLVLIGISLTSHLWLSGALFFLVGAAAVTFSASVTASLQLQSPPDMRGRFAAMVHLLITGSSPIGAMLTGVMAQALGVWIGVMVNGLLCLFGMVLAYAYFRHSRRSAGFDLGRGADPHDAAELPAREAAE